MKKLTALPTPALAGAVREAGENEAILDIKSCQEKGADMIDLHLSCLENTSEESLTRVISSTDLPVLALHYNTKCDWSSLGHSEEERVSLLLSALKCGAAGVDLQGYTFDLESKEKFCGEDKYSFTKGNPREIVTNEKVIEKQKELIERIHGMGKEVLLSCHPLIPMHTEQVVELALFLEKRGADIIKIVTLANTKEQAIESMQTMLELKKCVKTPVSYHATGEAGKLSRLLNPALGGKIAFCVSDYHKNATAGQPKLDTAKTVIEGLQSIL